LQNFENPWQDKTFQSETEDEKLTNIRQ